MSTDSDSSTRSESPRRRFRLSLRAMVLVVLVVGLGLGLIAREVDRQNRLRRAMMVLSAQPDVTQEVLNGSMVELRRSEEVTSRSGSYSSGPRAWEISVLDAATSEAGSSVEVLNLRMSGAIDDVNLRPIRVEDRGAKRNAEAIALLTRAYRERGWAFEVVVTSKSSGRPGATSDPPERVGPR